MSPVPFFSIGFLSSGAEINTKAFGRVERWRLETWHMHTTLSFINRVATCQSFPASSSFYRFSVHDVIDEMLLLLLPPLCPSFSLGNKVERRRSSAHTHTHTRMTGASTIDYTLGKNTIPKRAWKSLDLKMWMTRSIAIRSCLSWADVNRAWYSSSNSRARWASADDKRQKKTISILLPAQTYRHRQKGQVALPPMTASRTPMASC